MAFPALIIESERFRKSFGKVRKKVGKVRNYFGKNLVDFKFEMLKISPLISILL